jgi:hypothetical protein
MLAGVALRTVERGGGEGLGTEIYALMSEG